MSKFYSALMFALHVSELIGPFSGAFVYNLYVQTWYVVIRVLRVVPVLHVPKSANTASTKRS